MIIKDNEMLRHEAIRNLYNNVTLINGLGNFDADEAEVIINQSLVDAEVTRLQAEYDSKQYQRDRAEAYPSLAEQADMQFHDAVDGTSTWLDAISAVKLQFPKETI